MFDPRNLRPRLRADTRRLDRLGHGQARWFGGRCCFEGLGDALITGGRDRMHGNRLPACFAWPPICVPGGEDDADRYQADDEND